MDRMNQAARHENFPTLNEIQQVLSREKINRYRNKLNANGLGDCQTMAAKSAMQELAVGIYPNSDFVIVAMTLGETGAVF